MSNSKQPQDWVSLLATIDQYISLNHLFASLIGAAAGAGIIYLFQVYREKKREDEEFISFINQTIILLNHSLNSILNLKKQRVLPLRKEFEQFDAGLELAKKTGVFEFEYKESFFLWLDPKITFPFDQKKAQRLGAYKPQCLYALYRYQRELEVLNTVIADRNQRIEKHMDENAGEFISGETYTESQEEHKKTLAFIENWGKTSLENIEKTTDNLLCIGEHHLSHLLREVAQEVLKDKDYKKIVSSEIIDEEHKALLPSSDHIKLY